MSVLATDNFNRANANPIGAPWTAVTGESAMQIVSNAATPSATANDDSAIYTGISWPNDHYSKAKLFQSGTASVNQGTCLHVRSATGAITYYRLEVSHQATSNVSVEKAVSNSFTNLTTLTQAWTDGDVWELWAVGTAIRIFLNGVQVGSDIIDAAISSGSPGIGYSSTVTSSSVDDWEGGDFAVIDTRGNPQMAIQQRAA